MQRTHVPTSQPNQIWRRAMPHHQLNEVAVFADQYGIRFLRRVKNGTVSGVPQTKIAERNRIDRKGLLYPIRELRWQLRVQP